MGQPALDDRELYHSDKPVGEILRRARLHYGQSLQDIERALRIRAVQIEAIENNHFEQLPGRVYAIGFVRTYSEYLGLDGDTMVGIFKTQAGGKQKEPELQFPVSASESKLPSSWLVVASLLVFCFLLSYWWIYHTPDRDMVDRVPLPPSQETESAMAKQPMGPSAEEFNAAAPQAAPPASKPATPGLTLKILQNSWVEIKDKQGQEIVSRVLKEGEMYFVPDRPDLFMSLGNANGVRLEIDGEALAPLGKEGQVLRNIPLDSAYLKKNFATN